MMSYILDQPIIPSPSPMPQFPVYEKWSVLNSFDPDSDEFLDSHEVVYEAFVDEGGSSGSTSPSISELENHGAAPLGEAREVASTEEDVDGLEDTNTPSSHNSIPFPQPVRIVTSTSTIIDADDADTDPAPVRNSHMISDLHHLSMSPIPLHSFAHRQHISPLPTPQAQSPSPAPIPPYFSTWDRTFDVHVHPPSPTPLRSAQRVLRARTVHTRRESMPASIRLLS